MPEETYVVQTGGSARSREIKTMDKCRAELASNIASTEVANEQKADLQASIDSLTNSIANLKDAIATLTQEIAETRINMKRASEDREAENKVVGTYMYTRIVYTLGMAVDRVHLLF